MIIPVTRSPLQIFPDVERVVARFFFNSTTRTLDLADHLLALDEDAVWGELQQVLRGFARRHRDVSNIFRRHYNYVEPTLLQHDKSVEEITENRRMLIGAYFTKEFSIEAAAFFNPSAVLAPDQSGLLPDERRLVVSMRATGEGHLSSLEFRYIVVDADGVIRLDPAADRIEEARYVRDHEYHRESFCRKLTEMSDERHSCLRVIQEMPETFTYDELKMKLAQAKHAAGDTAIDETEFEEVLWLADSHHEISFSKDTDISERVILPISEWESRGIEDARFVRFVDDDGAATYYATYTAYDGFTILPKLVETTDFYRFRIRPIYGGGASNKNLALFPRKVNGRYYMLARIDGVNNYVMSSDSLTVWEKPQFLLGPEQPWEFVQMGNCGSPLETPEGWLVITHGVGPMRTYRIGVVLLALDDPTRVVARLPYPLLSPQEDEREGYVPNVVYSCGSIVLDGERLLLPYAVSDYASGFAWVEMADLLSELAKYPVGADDQGRPGAAGAERPIAAKW